MPLDQEPEQVEGALEGRARVCGDEAEVRICEATLSRTEEECHPTVRGVRAGESVLGAEKTVALGTGLARERRLLITGEPPKQAEDRKKPNPSACTGLAEHLLPRRHGLIQSFLSTAKLTRCGEEPTSLSHHGSILEAVLKRLDLAHMGAKRMARLWHRRAGNREA